MSTSATDTSSGVEIQQPVLRVETYLREAAAGVRRGDRLPSARQVMKVCGVGQKIYHRAVKRLQREGVIEIRSRSGLYRSDASPAEHGVIDYLFFGHPASMEKGSFHSEVLSSLMSRLAARSRSGRLHIMRSASDPQAVISSVLRQRSPEIITCSIDFENLRTLLSVLPPRATCLHVFPNLVDQISPCLTLDDVQIVRQQIEHLVELGHRDIAYLHAARDDEFFRPINVRRDAFCRLAVEYQLNVKPGWVCYAGWNPDNVRKAVGELMRREVRPSALIIADKIVSPVYSELRSMGLVPGKDVHVVGTDDMPWAEHVDPPLTSVRVSRAEVADRILDAMTAIKSGEDIKRSYFDTEIVARISTGPARNSLTRS